MNKIEIIGIDQDIYFEKLENGLEVYILPFKNKNNYYIDYFTKYGSLILDFYSEDKKQMVHMPEGIAHFLEHKMFEQEDGVNPFEFFAESGTGCNASTSYKATRYYCTGTEKLQENLDYLIKYINSPYFTDENVEKEKGIICEEINMIKDNPEWFAEEEMQRILYQRHNFRIPIAGSCSSIKKITKDDLYTTYNAFYNPNNMYLFVGGDVNPEEIINIVKNNKILNKITKKEIPQIKDIKEPLPVKEKIKTVELDNIKTNKLGYSLKLDANSFKEKDRFELSLYIGMILNIYFGSTSIFKDDMLKKGFLTTLSLERMCVDDFLIIEFWAETDTPNELVKEINKHFKEYNVTTEEVERCKKVWISSEVMAADNIKATISSLINEIIEYGEIKPNKVECIRNMTFEKLLKIKDKMEFSNTSTLILKNKEKKDD